ncbi:hypothetical protein KJ937_01640 [Patescibacteria group bacterium]|nr:hypothetical protein [Patescibacteria group bacterium]
MRYWDVVEWAKKNDYHVPPLIETLAFAAAKPDLLRVYRRITALGTKIVVHSGNHYVLELCGENGCGLDLVQSNKRWWGLDSRFLLVQN